MLDTLKGELRIFTKEVGEGKAKKTIYTACVGGTKQEDKTYLNVYMPVNFSRDIELKDIKNETDLLVKEAWIKAYKDKDDNIKPLLFINSAKIIK